LQEPFSPRLARKTHHVAKHKNVIRHYKTLPHCFGLKSLRDLFWVHALKGNSPKCVNIVVARRCLP